jgi:hypothetical protein
MNTKDKKEGLFSFFKSGKKELDLEKEAKSKNLNAKKLSTKAQIAKVLLTLGVGIKALFSFKFFYSVILIQDIINMIHHHPIGGVVMLIFCLSLFSLAFYYNYQEKKKLRLQQNYLQNAIKEVESKSDVKNNAITENKKTISMSN